MALPAEAQHWPPSDDINFKGINPPGHASMHYHGASLALLHHQSSISTFGVHQNEEYYPVVPHDVGKQARFLTRLPNVGCSITRADCAAVHGGAPQFPERAPVQRPDPLGC